MSIKLLKSISTVMLTLGAFSALTACGGRYDDESPIEEPLVDEQPVDEASVAQITIDSMVTSAGAVYTVLGSASVLVFDATSQALDFDSEDRTGMSLYTFANDTIGRSSCNSESCLNGWPPLLAAQNAASVAPMSLITRDDGNLQWALRGKPLYFFSGDAVPGDINGDGVGDLWQLAKTEALTLTDNVFDAIVGEIFVASGEVSVSVPVDASNPTEFIAEPRNMEGMSVYTFANDDENQSQCFGGCLVSWPALLADDGDIAEAPFSLVPRQMADGGATAFQWAYQGQPLYFFAQDTVAGDTNGKDITNWSLLRPQPFTVSRAGDRSLLSTSGVVKIAQPDGSGGELIELAAKHQFTVYTFDNDNDGESNCSDDCLINWPALIAHDGAVAQEPYSLVERESGHFQWAFSGKPLYLFSQDENPGDALGDDLSGVWHIIEIDADDSGDDDDDDDDGGYGY